MRLYLAMDILQRSGLVRLPGHWRIGVKWNTTLSVRLRDRVEVCLQLLELMG